MDESSGGRERSEQSGASERVSGASERANGRASGPVLQSVFLAVYDHSAQAPNSLPNPQIFDWPRIGLESAPDRKQTTTIEFI